MQSPRRSFSAVLRGPLPGVLLAAAFVVFTLLSLDPLIGLDRLFNYPFFKEWPQVDAVMAVLIRLGQRGVVLPLLFALVLYLARHRRTWEPVATTVVSVLVLNFSVGILKILTARGKPKLDDPGFFEQGLLYPSGHAANAIMYFGLAVFLVRRFGNADGVLARMLMVLTWVACLSMLVTLTYLQLHWVTDTVGGLLIGAAVLRSTTYDRGLVRRLTRYVEHLAGRLVAAWKRRRRQAATTPTAATPPRTPPAPRTPATPTTPTTTPTADAATRPEARDRRLGPAMLRRTVLEPDAARHAAPDDGRPETAETTGRAG